MIKEHKRIFIFIDCFILLLGIIGLVGGLISSLYFPNESWIGIVILVIFSWILYFGYQKEDFPKIIYIFSFMILFCLTLFYFDLLKECFQRLKLIIIYDYYLRFDELLVSLTVDHKIISVLLPCSMGYPIVLLIVSFMCHHQYKKIKMLIFLFLFLFPSLILHKLNVYTAYCFIIYMAYEYIFAYTLQFQNKQLTLKIVFISGISIALFLSHIFFFSNPLFNQTPRTLFQNYQNVLQGQNITGTSVNVDGSLPTHDVQLSQATALRVTSDEPVSTYLRGYSLARYENNEWGPVREDFVDEQSQNIIARWIKTYITGSTMSMRVESLKATAYQFVPYYAYIHSQEMSDSYYLRNDEPIDVYKTTLDLSLIDDKKKTIGVVKGYDDYVRKEYLNVPFDLKSQLMRLVETENNVSRSEMNEFSVKEKVNAVRNALFQTTSYDLKTGALPQGKDFIEYFLFENHKGSCTHYASSAALMLRCYGIPTRFVKGYIIRQSDFEGNVAYIGSHRSHAWVEVYLIGKGWVPVEVTPSYDDSQSISLADMLDDLSENHQITKKPDNPTQLPQDTPSNVPQSTQENQTIEVLPKINFIPFIITACFLGILCLYRLATYYRFTYKMGKLSSSQQAIKYYQRMKKVSRFGGVIPKEIVALAYKASFSQYLINDNELDFMKKQYQQYINEVYMSLSWYQKFIYKYIFGYK